MVIAILFSCFLLGTITSKHSQDILSIDRQSKQIEMRSLYANQPVVGIFVTAYCSQQETIL